MQNKKILYLLSKYIIQQVYITTIENLKSLNLYTKKIDDLVNNLDNNKIEEDILFYLNNGICFYK